MRINKYIALNLPTSRRKADNLIESGQVLVNGKITEVGYIVNRKDQIFVNGKKILDNKNHDIIVFINLKAMFVLITNRVMYQQYLN